MGELLNAKKICIKLNNSINGKISLNECKNVLKIHSVDLKKHKTIKASIQNLTPLQQNILFALNKNSLTLKEACLKDLPLSI